MAASIAITFALNAALGGSFKDAFKSAAESARNVGAEVRKMESSSTGKLGASILRQREKIRGLSTSLRDAKTVLSTLQNQALATGGGTAMLARQISQAESRVASLSGALKRQNELWKNTVAEVATTSGSIRRLADDYGRLQGKMEKGRNLASSLHANQAQTEALRNQRADLQGRLLSTMATSASIALPVKLAISAEDTFADLRKVMDAPEEVMGQVFADAQAMSARTGKSFEDVISIMTSAAQAGLGKTREELLSVADQAVKMSIAWGVSVDQAGKSMATWRSSMEMTDEQAMRTADVINALSNSMNAEAGEIDQIFTRMGPMMASAGMATQDIAALATAFKAAGAQVEVSGTAMKNFKNVLTAGAAGLTDAKQNVLNFLKIDANELQKQFYNDSKGAILRVLEALKDVRPEEKDSIASTLFGQESIAAISPLLKNIDLVKQAFSIANGKVDGSVDEEYANRMKTTATSISQMTQSLRNLGMTAGKALLPAVGAVSRAIAGVAGTIGKLVEKFPGISSAIMITGGVIAAFAAGSLALGLVINTVRSFVTSVRGAFLRMAASQVTATATTGTLTGATGAFGASSRMAGLGARFFAGGLRSILFASGVGALIVGLGFAVNALIDNWDGVVSAMSAAWNWVTTTWSQLGVFFTELGNNLAAIFPGFWNGICVAASAAKEFVTGVWNGAVEFFTGIGNSVSGVFSWCWTKIKAFAVWAFEGVAGVWNGAVEFFTGIVDSIRNVFSGLFAWLKEKFEWVFSTIDAVSGFVGKITGAVGDALNKAFGSDEKKAASGTGAKSESEESVTSIPNSAIKQPLASIMNSGAEKPDIKSFAAYNAEREAAKKSGGKSGGGTRGSGGGSRVAGSGKTDRGPVTVVSLGGDNSQIQTLFIPAGANSGQGSKPLNMPAVEAARNNAARTRALPQTPALLSGNRGSGKSGGGQASINIDFTQNFDLMAQDPSALRKVLENLKPDFEALVRKALAQIASDKRRTSYAQ